MEMEREEKKRYLFSHYREIYVNMTTYNIRIDADTVVKH